MIDNKTIVPYDPIDYGKPDKIIIRQKGDQKDLVDYKFEFEISGDNLNRKILFTAGYLGGTAKDQDNIFILEEESIDDLITKLQLEKERIQKAKENKKRLEELHKQLGEYLKAGYITKIIMRHQPTRLPPYYNKLIYKAFIIEPVFKNDCPSEVNTGFNFLEVLHLPIEEKEFDKVMNYVRHYEDIPIETIGFDIRDEIEKRKKEAIKELNGRTAEEYVNRHSEEQKKKYAKMMNDMGIPVNVMNYKNKKK